MGRQLLSEVDLDISDKYPFLLDFYFYVMSADNG